MPFSITKRYHFEAAHFLPRVPDTHKCKRMHGHNYAVEVSVRREESDTDDIGFVIDFWDLDPHVQILIDKVDHRVLNDIKGLDNPTAENIGHWFWWELEETIPTAYITITRIRVYETPSCWADYVPTGV